MHSFGEKCGLGNKTMRLCKRKSCNNKIKEECYEYDGVVKNSDSPKYKDHNSE